jgi:hypothetical protein
MNPSAHVTSVAALADFRAALATFAHEAKDALGAVETEIRRTADWLDDQLQHWQAEVRRREDDVFQGKQELARRRMMKVGGRSPDCTEQEEALQLARDRLEHAEDQRSKTRVWIRELPLAITDYEGRARQLMSLLEGNVPRACALLDRKADALEAYVGLREAPPERKQP